MKVCLWLNANKLLLNSGKSNLVIFHPYQHGAHYDVNLKVYDNSLQKSIPLERKSYVKYLRVLIGSNLSWRYNIDHISSKISTGVGIISRLRHFAPTNTLKRTYRSLIEPYISYLFFFLYFLWSYYLGPSCKLLSEESTYSAKESPPFNILL